MALTGGAQLSFYDWYADLPPASPQVLGDQTDVPESADWWHAGYLLVWGINMPVTRTPDAHFMVEARYRGQKVVVVSPDYAEHVKFADDWLAVPPGRTAPWRWPWVMSCFKEFHVERRGAVLHHYVKTYTDMPFLVMLREHESGGYVADRFLTAADLGESVEAAEWKTVLLDSASGAPVVPNGSLGFRWTDSGRGKWNLDLGDVDPALTLIDRQHESGRAAAAALRHLTGRRAAPRRAGGAGGRPSRHHRVRPHSSPSTVSAVRACPGSGRPATTTRAQPYTPAWQERLTTIPAATATRMAREFARNAELTDGRSMIVMGPGSITGSTPTSPTAPS